MKRAFIIICVCLIAGALLYQKISAGSGYILISLGNTSIEMSFWMGVLTVILVSASLILLWMLLHGFWRMLFAGTATIAKLNLLQGSEKKTQRQTARGLIEFMEGNWRQARKHLLNSAKKAEFPMINYLAAARSTYEMGNDDEALELLHKAETSGADSGLAVALTQARMLLANKKYEQCLANLERAKNIAPHHPVVLDLLRNTYALLEDWQSLKELIPELKKQKAIKPKDLQQLEQLVYSELLYEAGEKAARQSVEEAQATLSKEWDSFPHDVRKQNSMIEKYARLLMATHNEEAVELLLRKAVKDNWNDDLVVLYGKVAGKDVKRQLLTAETWLKERPGSATLLLTLGRLSLRNERWDEAREYFETSLKLKKNPETYAELARLLTHLQDFETSADYYQRGLLMTTDALPPLPMPSSAEQSRDDNLGHSHSLSA